LYNEYFVQALVFRSRLLNLPSHLSPRRFDCSNWRGISTPASEAARRCDRVAFSSARIEPLDRSQHAASLTLNFLFQSSLLDPVPDHCATAAT
jgi:hypothetical protein